MLHCNLFYKLAQCCRVFYLLLILIIFPPTVVNELNQNFNRSKSERKPGKKDKKNKYGKIGGFLTTTALWNHLPWPTSLGLFLGLLLWLIFYGHQYISCLTPWPNSLIFHAYEMCIFWQENILVAICMIGWLVLKAYRMRILK